MRSEPVEKHGLDYRKTFDIEQESGACYNLDTFRTFYIWIIIIMIAFFLLPTRM